MSKIPDTKRTKYNHNDPFRWVDSQWEKFMTEQKVFKARIKELEGQLKDLVSRVPSSYLINSNERTDEWRIEQFNRHRDVEDQVKTIEEMNDKVSETFNKKYIYESPDGGVTTYRRKFGDYDSPREEVDEDRNPIAEQLELF